MRIEYKDVDEIVAVTFPYADEIGAAAISGVVVTVTVLDGIDADPSAMLQGPATIDGSDALQLVKLGTAGNKYGVKCAATLNDGRKLNRRYYLEVLAA